MKNTRKILSVLLVLAMLLSAVPFSALAVSGGSAAVSEPETENVPSDEEIAKAIRENAPTLVGGGVTAEKIENPGLDVRLPSEEIESKAIAPAYAEDEIVRVIVKLESDGLLDMGYSTDEVAMGGTAVMNSTDKLEKQQSSVLAEINAIAAEEKASVEVRYSYTVAMNGLAVAMPYGMLESVRQIEGVKSAFVAPSYSVPEDMSDTASPSMYATKYNFGSAQTWAAGYTGAGMRVAVVDTGLDLDHPSFAAAPAVGEGTMTMDDLTADVISRLNASDMYPGVTADKLYRSEKVPYGFNYVDESLNVTHDYDEMGDHGTHVAGIVGANALEGTDVVGVAPDAQILVMKVFGSNGGAYFDDILAAIEDAIVLGADAINMSLGAGAGFDYEGDAEAAAVYASIADTDIILAVASGNDTTAALGNGLGTDRNFTSDPDNGIVSSPATYPGTTVVASLDNESIMHSYIEGAGRQIPYTDVADYNFELNFAGQELEYVVIGGLGEASDYENVDVYGKVALISRGVITYVEKQTYAYDNGAIACIVYDNIEEDLINMYDEGLLPNIFVSKADGEALKAAAVDGIGTVTVPELGARLSSPLASAGQISAFSSWGVSESLELTPDITAPGGSIYSTVDGGKYDSMSGTSMATPHIAGMSALVLEYLKESFPGQSDSWYHTAAEALIMSTATPIVEDTGVLYSPRAQGAGAANVYSAVTSPAYLTVNGATPKVSLGDDDERSGVYTFSFEINNLTDEPLRYRISGQALTDQVDLTYAEYGMYFMGETSKALDARVHAEYVADIQYLLDGVNGLHELDSETVDRYKGLAAPYDILDTADLQVLYEDGIVVPANGSMTVDVTVTLSDEDKAYMDAYYENGIYVDGFVYCYPADGEGVELSVPFLAFYGDWSAARVFEDSWYHGSDDDDLMYNRYMNILWTDFGSGDSILGANPYLASDEYTPAHNVLSPNGDGYVDYVEEIYLSMMRGARAVDFTWTDGDGNVLFTQTADYVRKSFYSDAYGLCLPFQYSADYDLPLFDCWSMMDAGIEDGDTLTLTVDAYLDDGDDVLDDQIVIPIHIDTVAPSLDEVGMDINEGGRRILTLTVSDNYDAAAIITLTPAGDVVDRIPVNGELGENGETATVEIDVTTYDSNLYVVVCDYGGAQSYYSVSFAGNLDIDPNSFYAYRKYASVPVQWGTWSYIVSTSEYNGWVSFTDADAMLQHSFADGEVGVGAAEYVDGYILAVTDDNQMFAMKAGSYTRVDVADLSAYPAVIDMALDISTGTLYALTDIDDFGANILLNLSPVTGEVLGEVEINGLPEEHRLVALACDNEGRLYTVSYHEGWDYDTYDYVSDGNKLYSIDAESGAVTLIGDTGYELTGYGYDIYYQSMTVDHETDTLYWATYSGYRETNHFLALDKETGAILASTETEYSSELTGLFKPSEYLGIFDEVGDEATDILLTPESVKSPSGSAVSFAAAPIPFFTSLGELTWSSSDETVLESLGDGVFYCASEGTATVTVTNGTISATAEVEVVEMTAELRAYDTMYDYVWYSVNAGDMSGASVVETAREPGGIYDSFFAAAYAEGSVYAFDTSGYFYKLDPETLDGQVLGRNTDYDGTSGVMKALAFNHADGYMYGIAQQTYGWSSYFYLVRVNLTNGATETVGSLSSLGQYVANLAISPDGTFYTIVTVDYDENYNAIDSLVSFKVGEYSIDWDSMASIEMIGYSSFSEGMSMVWSVDDECLYATDDSGYLYWIDPATGSAINLGYLGATVCLTELPTVEPETHYGEVIYADYPQNIVVAAGGTTSQPLEVYPWNSRLSGITYTIADTDIATVDEFGTITGVAPGVTTITVDSTDEIADELGLPFDATVSVINADVTLGAYLLNEFATGGSSYWFSFNAAQPEEILDDAYAGEDYLLCAGAYYNGKIYAVIQDYSGELNYKDYFAVIDPFTSDFEVLKQVNYHVRDMAFDYTTGVMYAAYDSGSASGIAQVDITTGDFVTVSNPDILIAALAVDGNGVMYAIDEYSCCLYEIEPMTGETYEIGDTGVEAVGMYQSMHWDYETGNLYWAQCDDGYGNGFYYVDTETGAACRLGTVATGCQVSALYTVDGTEPALPDTVDACGVVIRDRDVVVIGETLTIDAFVLPVSVVPLASADIEWTSSDESVATVENGVVTGVSAGTATITATIGSVSSECTVTVLSEARNFYAYNRTEGSWISFAMDDPSAVETVKTEENLSPITAATLAGDTLYAYDEDGYFYTVDTETFVRSEPMTGVSEMSFSAWGYDENWDPYEIELDFEVTDLSYDEATGKLYMLLIASGAGTYGTTYQSYIGEVDTETGALMNDTWISNDVDLPANLLLHNSDIYYVDCWISGMLNIRTYNAAWDYYNYPEQKALITDYWGMPLDSRSFIEDPLTGTVYVIRDLSDEGEKPHAPTLYTITLGDGNIIPVGDDGVIGLPGTYDGPVITGLFIK